MTEPEPAIAVDPPAARRSPVVGVLATLLVASVTVNIVLLVQKRERDKLDDSAYVDRENLYAADGRQTARFEYGDSQEYPVRTFALGRDGRVESITYDLNSDGWFDKHEIYTKNGVVTTHRDIDNDGVLGDVSLVTRSDVPVYELLDDDGDRWQETARVLDARGRPRLVAYDRDADGIAERMQCFDANGVARELPPIDCPR